MFNYIPPYFAAETADTIEEAERWYEDKTARRTPNLLPRDEVARAINSEVKAGRGSPHGGVLLDIASRRSEEYIKRRLPSMYHQFKQLADVDITKEPMEVGPTMHYIMGGVRVDADSCQATVPGLFAAGEVAGGMHGANRLGGNSLSDLLVFGRRAGIGAAEFAAANGAMPRIDEAAANAIAEAMTHPFEAGSDAENPYTIQRELQDTMHELVGIIRTKSELQEARQRIAGYRERAARAGIEGHRQYNPGWHLAMDLQSLLTVSEAIARAAETREESRGGHTRDDFPNPDDANWGTRNVVVRQGPDGEMTVTTEPLMELPAELKSLFEEAH
jgi:succinate dehydrogenase / fumarate reductase flavoprotein subunit